MRWSASQVTLESIVQTLQDVIFVRLRFDRATGLGSRLAILLDQHPNGDRFCVDGAAAVVDRDLLFTRPRLRRTLCFKGL